MQTLEELKRENAEPEIEQEAADPQADEQIEEEAAEVETEETEEEAETESEEAEETEVEPWMLGDDEASQSSEDEQVVPLKTLIKTRTKLKGERDELKEEIEKLKAQIAQPKAPAESVSTKIPTLEDFDYDDAKYAEAMHKYNQEVVSKQLAEQQRQAQREALEAARRKAIEQSVDQHYERAKQMISASGISADVYTAQEKKVRDRLEAMYPGEGDQTVDALIDSIGEGSEKLLFAMGRQEAVMNEFLNKLNESPFKAIAYASKKAAEWSAPSKRKSTAPKPAAKPTGGSQKVAESAELRKYKEAHKKGDSNKAFQIKLAAKRAGIDTKSW